MSPIMPLQAVGFSKEVTPGIFVSPTNFIPCNSASVQTMPKIVRPEQMRANRGQVIDALVGYETGVQFTADLVPAPLGRLVAYAMGVGSDSVTGSAGAGYDHALVPKNDLPSVSFEISHDEVTQLLSRQVVGCMVDQFSIRSQAQALASFECTLIGQAERTPATPGLPSYATPTFPLIQPFDFSLALVSYAGGTDSNVTDYTLSFTNGVQRVFTGNQSQYVRRLVPTRRNVNFSAGFDFVNLVQYTDWKNAVYINGIDILMTARENIPGATNPWQIQFTMPRLRAQDQFDIQSSSEVLQAQLTFSTTIGPYAQEITSRWRTGDSAAY